MPRRRRSASPSRSSPISQPFARLDAKNMLALTFCLMVGTAGLPHILMRYYTVPSVKDARMSVGWSLFFIFLLYFTAPAVAAFARNEVLNNVDRPADRAASRRGWRTGARSASSRSRT